MTVELDIEIQLTKFPRKISLELAEYFPVEFQSTKMDKEEFPYCGITVRAAAESQVVTNVDTGIRDFLQRLAAYTEAIKQSGGVLHLGIFYDLNETVVFPFRLSVETRRPGGASVHGFFIGEFMKVAATLLLLFGVASLYRDLNWLALIVGFIAALKSYFLIFLFGRSRA